VNLQMVKERIVVLKLVASCRWNCGLGKLSTILEMKILRRQLYVQLPKMKEKIYCCYRTLLRP
jgi:hypothetical protein